MFLNENSHTSVPFSAGVTVFDHRAPFQARGQLLCGVGNT